MNFDVSSSRGAGRGDRVKPVRRWEPGAHTVTETWQTSDQPSHSHPCKRLCRGQTGQVFWWANPERGLGDANSDVLSSLAGEGSINGAVVRLDDQNS